MLRSHGFIWWMTSGVIASPMIPPGGSYRARRTASARSGEVPDRRLISRLDSMTIRPDESAE